MNELASRWRAMALVWCGALLGFWSVAYGSLETTDSAITMHAARALLHRGDSGLLTAEQGGDLLGERLGAMHIAQTQAAGNRSLGKIGTNGRAYVWFPIGHAWLLTPFVAAGEALQSLWPAAETTFRDTVAPGADAAQLVDFPSYVEGHPVLTQGLIALLVPSSFAATSLLLLFLIARALGATRRDAAIAAVGTLLATQFFALGRETLSDGPGLCCMLAALLVVVRVHMDAVSPRLLIAGGIAAGWAVLLRYQNAFLLLACGVVLLLACRRRGRWMDLGWFVLGGVPFLVLLLVVNFARFGNPFDTGYPEYAAWFDRPMWSGLLKFFAAAGRGVLWLSPLLWLGLPLVLQRRHVPQLRWLAGVLFVLPFLLFASARGWQGGQCWGARYVTPGVVLLLAIVLPQARPWVTWPRTWMLLLGCGLFVNFTSVLAPTRGQIQLASQAVRAEAAMLGAGRGLSEDEQTDRISWHPRYSPLHANWSYAVHSHQGGFEDPQGRPRNGSENTIEPLYGISSADPGLGLAPQRWEDRCGRHLWWRFWSDLLGLPAWLLLGPVLLGALLSSAIGWRRLLRD